MNKYWLQEYPLSTEHDLYDDWGDGILCLFIQSNDEIGALDIDGRFKENINEFIIAQYFKEEKLCID